RGLRLTAPEIGQRDAGRDEEAQREQPHHRARDDQCPVGGLRGPRETPLGGHQQLVWAALFEFDDNTVPSLVVMEQFNWLTRKRLGACTEPTSDWEIGVTVSDHGMYTLRWVRRRPVAST